MAKKFFFFNQFFTPIQGFIHNASIPVIIQFTMFSLVKALKSGTNTAVFWKPRNKWSSLQLNP